VTFGICAFEPYANPPTLTRRYLWGPGDEGSQELLAYYDAAAIAADNGQPRWVLQDLNHDVIGIADIDGNVPRLVARYSYDAYGRVLSAVAPPVGVSPAPAPPPPPPPPPLSVGHHGLFAEDADTNLADLTHGPNTNWWDTGVGSPLSPDTQNLLYLTPNRVLSRPSLVARLASGSRGSAAATGRCRSSITPVHHGVAGFSSLHRDRRAVAQVRHWSVPPRSATSRSIGRVRSSVRPERSWSRTRPFVAGRWLG
jgi:hypothetical protein